MSDSEPIPVNPGAELGQPSIDPGFPEPTGPLPTELVIEPAMPGQTPAPKETDSEDSPPKVDKVQKRFNKLTAKLNHAAKENEQLQERVRQLESKEREFRDRDVMDDLATMDLPDEYDDWPEQRRQAYMASEAARRLATKPESQDEIAALKKELSEMKYGMTLGDFTDSQREAILELREETGIQNRQELVTLASLRDPETFAGLVPPGADFVAPAGRGRPTEMVQPKSSSELAAAMDANPFLDGQVGGEWMRAVSEEAGG